MDDLTFAHGVAFGAALTAGACFLFLLGAWIVRPWFRAFMTGCPVSLVWVLGARLRGSPIDMLIDAYIALRWRQKEASIRDIERCYVQNSSRISDVASLLEALARSDSARM